MDGDVGHFFVSALFPDPGYNPGNTWQLGLGTAREHSRCMHENWCLARQEQEGLERSPLDV